MENWKKLEAELSKNPEFIREYELLGPQFELACQLIDARLRQGLTQAELARKVGSSQPAIARMESGSYNPSLKMLKRVAAATDSALVVRLEPTA